MVTVGQIKQALSKIDGYTFLNREALETAIYPLFGPFQAAMPGKTFRDLADMLIEKGWAIQDRGTGYVKIQFPPTPTEAEIKQIEKLGPILNTTNLSYREIALLVELHSGGRTCKKYDFSSLVRRGLVERADASVPTISEVPEDKVERAAQIQTEIAAHVISYQGKSIKAIMEGNYEAAHSLVTELRDAHRYLQVTYRLTQAGQVYMEDQTDSRLAQPPVDYSECG